MEQEKPNNVIPTLMITCFGIICFLIGVSSVFVFLLVLSL